MKGMCYSRKVGSLCEQLGPVFTCLLSKSNDFFFFKIYEMAENLKMNIRPFISSLPFAKF